MKFLITMIVFVSATTAFADVDDSIQKMVKENVISETEAKKIKRHSQWSGIDKSAIRIAARGPASVSGTENAIEELQAKDLELAQFKAIQTEMKRILHR